MSISMHTMELVAAHLNTLGRLLNGADSITLDRFGEITIQGKAENLHNVADLLTLERTPDRDHGYDNNRFEIWAGESASAFGRFQVRLVLVSTVQTLACGCPVSPLQ